MADFTEYPKHIPTPGGGFICVNSPEEEADAAKKNPSGSKPEPRATAAYPDLKNADTSPAKSPAEAPEPPLARGRKGKE